MIVVLFLFFGISAFAQQFQYRLEGSFQSNPNPGVVTPLVVNYSINWNETATSIQGLYQDNYFARSGPRMLSGVVDPNGRTFSVILPMIVGNVKQITVTLPQSGSISGSVSTNVTTKDSIGRTIDNQNNTSLMSTMPVATAGTTTTGENPCTVGFGSLTGFCGHYDGPFNEVSDTRNLCDLMVGGNPRLELGADTVFRLYPNFVPGTVNPPVQNIGAFLPSPTSNSITVTNRTCGPLPGTSFIPGNCKTMNLSGVFFNEAGTVKFTGTYTISDDVTSDNCTYSMSLTREETL